MSFSWPLVRMADLVKQIYHYENVLPNKPYSLLGMRSKICGPFLRETKLGSEVSAEKFNKVEEGNLIYSRLFAWQGSFGLITKKFEQCYVSNEFPLFEVNTTRASSKYLIYWLGQPETLNMIEKECSGTTPGTRNRYNEKFFLELVLPLPPLAEQKSIVDKIESIIVRIEEVKNNRQAIIDDADAMLLSAFRETIKDAKYRPMHDAAPIVRRPVKIDIGNGYPELGVRCFGKGTFHKPVLEGYEVGTKKLYYIEQHDLIFSNVFAWEGAIAVAKSEDQHRVGSHRFITCLAKKDVVTSSFLCFYFLTSEGIEKIREASPGGAGRNKTLGLKKLENINVPIPSYEKQLIFDKLQAKIAAIKSAQQDSLIEIDALLPSVLDRAFKGKLLKCESSF